eukprot:430661-Amphidinium_carterae.2
MNRGFKSSSHFMFCTNSEVTICQTECLTGERLSRECERAVAGESCQSSFGSWHQGRCASM